jgi:hypothetical protein
MLLSLFRSALDYKLSGLLYFSDKTSCEEEIDVIYGLKLLQVSKSKLAQTMLTLPLPLLGIAVLSLKYSLHRLKFTNKFSFCQI